MFNIFTIAFVAVVVAIILAIVITRHTPPGFVNRVPPEDDAADPSRFIQSFAAVEDTAQRICDENNLKVTEKMKVSEQETYWLAHCNNPVFYGQYVFGFFQVSSPELCVTMSSLLEFKDFVKSAGSTKGFYFTNGFFTRDVHQPLEGPKVALYNARKIGEERLRMGVAWQFVK